MPSPFSGTATARRTAPSRCNGTDDPIVAAIRSAVAGGWPSSQRPIHPVLDGPTPKLPLIMIAIEVKCERSGLG